MARIREGDAPYTVYCLTDPETEEVVYIGCTCTPLRVRLLDHLHCSAQGYRMRNPKNRWIRSLLDKGILPEIKAVELCVGAKQGYRREAYWIDYFTAYGAQLTNDHNPIASYKVIKPTKGCTRGQRVSREYAFRIVTENNVSFNEYFGELPD